MEEEYMVDNGQTAEDESVSEEEFDQEFLEEEEEAEESLDSLTEEEKSAPEPEPEQKANEPGYVQKRIDRALARERDNIKAEVKAEMETLYAPIRERLLDMDAKELVRQGEFKSIERAKEYLQLKQGIAPQAENKPAPQPRNEQGQFAPRQDPATSARIDMLAHQAQTIKARTGIDVMAEFSNNPDVKNSIISGKMDFYDVAEQMKPSRRKPPAPARSSNGASGHSPNAIESMSKEQFARLEKKIAEGARYSLK